MITDDRTAIDERVCSPYEAVTRARLEALAEEVERLRHRTDSVLWGVASAVVIDIVIRLT